MKFSKSVFVLVSLITQSAPIAALAQHTGGSFGGTRWGSGSSSSSSSSRSSSSSSSSRSSYGGSRSSSPSYGSSSDDDDNSAEIAAAAARAAEAAVEAAAEAARRREEERRRAEEERLRREEEERRRCRAAAFEVDGYASRSSGLANEACVSVATDTASWVNQLAQVDSAIATAEQGMDPAGFNWISAHVNGQAETAQSRMSRVQGSISSLESNLSQSRSEYSSYSRCVSEDDVETQRRNLARANGCMGQYRQAEARISQARAQVGAALSRVQIRLNTLAPAHGSDFNQAAEICRRIPDFRANGERIQSCLHATNAMERRLDLVVLCNTHASADGLNACLGAAARVQSRLPIGETAAFCESVRSPSILRSGPYMDSCMQAIAGAHAGYASGRLSACTSLFRGQVSFANGDSVQSCLGALGGFYLESGDVEGCSRSGTDPRSGVQCLRVAGRLTSGQTAVQACTSQSATGRQYGQCLLNQARAGIASQLPQ